METELPPEPAATPEPTPQPPPEIVPTPDLTSPASIPPAPEAPTYSDRSNGLMIFGIAQVILGLLAALMVPLAGLSMFLSRLRPAGALRPGMYVSSMATYGFAAATLLILGFGSIQTKRWARALTLVVSWYWLITGVLVTILVTAVLPVAMRSALALAQQSAPGGPAPEFSTGVMAVILTIIIVFIAFFLIAVPTAFVVFYSRRDVEQTCRDRDPIERWTDRTPLPVLGASVVLFAGALYMAIMGATAPLFPFFGRYLTGIGGSACFMGVAALDIYLSIAIFRLELTGWWIAVSTVPIRLLSMGLTYAKGDLMFAYSKLGMSDQQLRMINANPMFRGHVILWWSLLSLVIFFGYLLWLRRYFKPPVVASMANPVSNLG